MYNQPDNALAQFELLRAIAQKQLNDAPEFRSALAIYEELCELQKTLYSKEISLRKDAFSCRYFELH